MPRPCTQNVRVFRRELSDDQRKILLAAGDGDTTIGFNECLSLWASIHGLKASLILNVPRETTRRKSKSKYPENGASDPLASSLSDPQSQ